MQWARGECHARIRGATAKKVDQAAWMDKRGREFPGGRQANRLDCHVDTTPPFGFVEDHCSLLLRRTISAIENYMGTQTPRQGQASFSASGGDHARALPTGQSDQQEAQRPCSQDRNGIARVKIAGLNAMQGTGQRFGERRRAERGPLWQMIKVQADNALRHQQVFGVSPVEEKQIFAQAKLAASAIKALLTGSRIGHDHGISLNALCHARPCGGNDSGYFVTEASRCPSEENGMTSLQRFEIGAASGRGSNLEQYFSGSWLRNRQFFQAKIERRVKAGGKHCLSSIAFIFFQYPETDQKTVNRNCPPGEQGYIGLSQRSSENPLERWATKT
jgi:hypothetical protein